MVVKELTGQPLTPGWDLHFVSLICPVSLTGRQKVPGWHVDCGIPSA